MEFKQFAEAIHDKFNQMSQDNLLVVEISKDELWEAYQNSFPTGENEIYKERPVHDCNICRQFIKNIGSVVSVTDNGRTTIWDIDVAEPYATVARTMNEFILSKSIYSPFIRNEKKYGVYSNTILDEGKTITFNHFHCVIPSANFSTNSGSDISKSVSTASVFKRGLEEISKDVIETVIDLIRDGSIYRGEEHLKSVKSFNDLLTDYQKLSDEQTKDDFVWKNYKNMASRIRNSVIGSLLTDLTAGVDLEGAVKSFESKVAPANYKRPKALVTKKMIENAIKKIDDLGIRDSLPRRQAVSNDVSINNVLFADRTTSFKDRDPLLDALGVEDEPKISLKALENAPEISMEDFLEKVLPGSKSVELVTGASLGTNHVYLSAPANVDAPNILKWDNNFSWSYKGNLADSDIARNVAAKGGDLEGLLRFSLQWNENDQDNTDLDAHCYECMDIGGSNEISFGAKTSRLTGGKLDIDITNPQHKVAVENIVWKELKNGSYRMFVRDYSGRGLRDSFKCEIVFNDTTYTYEYKGDMVERDVNIATITFANGKFEIKHDLKPDVTNNNKLVKVKMVCLSPNHWDNNNVGNKHYFFLTEDNKPEEPFRGFYNEFLSNDLNEHRKVFDMLSNKMMCETDENGLSGYGFSSTKRTEIHLKVDGKLHKVLV